MTLSLVPRIIIESVYHHPGTGTTTRTQIAGFSGESDALLFWEAAGERRRQRLVMVKTNGVLIKELAHTGEYYGATRHFSHCQAVPGSMSNESKARQREHGWMFVDVTTDAFEVLGEER